MRFAQHLAVRNNYGKKIAIESFASESALLDGLLLDITKAEIKACTKELSGIDAIIDDLKKAQKDKYSTFANNVEAKIEKLNSIIKARMAKTEKQKQ